MGRKINEQHVVPPFPTTFRVARRFTVILSFGFSRANERTFRAHVCCKCYQRVERTGIVD